jgi:hypothetical protein
MLDESRLDQAVDFVQVPLMQSDKDGALVREVLVDRTNTDPRNLGDAVGRDGVDGID